MNVASDSELNSVAFSVPVEGLKNNLVDDTSKSSIDPAFDERKPIYLVASVVSSVIAMVEPSPAEPVKPSMPVEPVKPSIPEIL